MNPKLLLSLALAVSAGLSGGCASTPPVANAQISEIRMFSPREGWAQANVPDGYLVLRTSNGGHTWINVTPHMQTRAFPYNLYSCEFSKAQTAWLSINGRPGLLLTTNGGSSWAPVTAPFGYFTEASAVHFYRDDLAMAEVADGGLGSEYYTFYETRNGGMTWKLVPIAPPGPAEGETPGTLHLSNICGDEVGFYEGGKFVITYGDSGDDKPKGYVSISISTNFGNSWQDKKLPLPDKWRDDYTAPFSPVFFGPNDGFLPVELFGQDDHSRTYLEFLLYATGDGGQSWSLRTSLAEGKNGLTGSACDIISRKDIVVRMGRKLNVSHNGAVTWRTIEPNIDLDLEDSKRDVAQMSFTDARHGWLIISDDTRFSPNGNFLLYQTKNGGKTWKEVPVRILN
jgi:photosystem II stability/assembly factor-like uncharacterized protein